MSRNRLRFSPATAVGAVLLAITAAVAVTFALRRAQPDDTHFHPALSEGIRQEHRERMGKWADVEFFELSGAAGAAAAEDEAAAQRSLASAWSDRIDDPRGLLSPVMREAILSRLAEHAMMRSKRSPEPYLQLARREAKHYRWRSGREELAPVARGMYQVSFGREPETWDAKTLLRRLWERWSDEEGHRFERIAIGEDGALIIIRKARTDQRMDDLRNSEGNIYDGQFWYGPASFRARTFRVPRRSLGEVLQGRSSTMRVFCHIIVETADDRLLRWTSHWYWDPDSDVWLCEHMGGSGAHSIYLPF